MTTYQLGRPGDDVSIAVVAQEKEHYNFLNYKITNEKKKLLC